MHQILLTLTCIVFLTGCATTSNTGTPAPLTSGIEGTVTVGPMCPVVQVGTPCPDQPYAAMLVALDAGGTEVARAQADAQGKFRLPLMPGTYTLRPLPPEGKPLPYAAEQIVTVVARQFTLVTIQYDSGIR
jgi:hypothetical protein